MEKDVVIDPGIDSHIDPSSDASTFANMGTIVDVGTIADLGTVPDGDVPSDVRSGMDIGINSNPKTLFSLVTPFVIS